MDYFTSTDSIDAISVQRALRFAVVKWNAEHPDDLKTYRQHLINVLTHWRVLWWSSEKTEDLVGYLTTVFTRGLRGWENMNADQLMIEFLEEGVGGECLSEEMCLGDMLTVYPWIMAPDLTKLALMKQAE